MALCMERDVLNFKMGSNLGGNVIIKNINQATRWAYYFNKPLSVTRQKVSFRSACTKYT